MQVVALARSLGRKLNDEPETWAWSDAGGATLTLVFRRARLERWELHREPEAGASGTLLESPD
jgi:hypothetical protein